MDSESFLKPRLYGSLEPQKPLLVIALEEEATYIKTLDLPVLVCGVGKLHAAISLMACLREHTPSRIVNLGTAGALRSGLEGTHVVSTVMQHDFDNKSIVALTGIGFSPVLKLHPQGKTLASGDRFVTDDALRKGLAVDADLVDMEGYAVASVARSHGLKVMLVKDVSDEAGESSHRTWKESVDACARRLYEWAQENLEA